MRPMQSNEGACTWKRRGAQLQKDHRLGSAGRKVLSCSQRSTCSTRPSKTTPHRIFQDLVLIQEDVSNGHQWNLFVISPEERQSDQPTWVPIDKSWWRAQEILLSICEAELEEVDGHEREQHQTSDDQIQLTAHQSRRQLLIPSPLQTNEDVQ